MGIKKGARDLQILICLSLDPGGFITNFKQKNISFGLKKGKRINFFSLLQKRGGGPPFFFLKKKGEGKIGRFEKGLFLPKKTHFPVKLKKGEFKKGKGDCKN